MEKEFTINFQGREYPVKVIIHRFLEETMFEVTHQSEELKEYVEVPFHITRKNQVDAEYRFPLVRRSSAEHEFKHAVAEKIRDYENGDYQNL